MAGRVWCCPTAAGEVVVLQSTRVDGDFNRDRVAPPELERRRRRLLARPWTMLDEVHGTALVTVEWPGAGDGATGDALVTNRDDAVLGVWTGDCAAVVLVSPGGRFGAAHAGWRGLAAGVLDALVDAVDPDHDGGCRAFVGPVIGPCCYEFGAAELAAVAAGLGVAAAAVSATTNWGRPSLDVPAAIVAALGPAGVELETAGVCTRCDDRFFSHRRGDPERHVTAAWRVPRAAAP